MSKKMQANKQNLPMASDSVPPSRSLPSLLFMRDWNLQVETHLFLTKLLSVIVFVRTTGSKLEHL